ncbi:MAG: Trk system potassium transporter TrkA [Proteobacteria bacterium]|nr:Trk system potassium transporter TrkA [Pseudomonadota bacterium]MDA1132300.1 Trk system potassium transporter TrkA [Pseudomonadota bacterium]
MKVIVCGAGQVGFSIASRLAAEQNDVTVIDQSAQLIKRVSEQIDAQTIVGHASRPDVLAQAGAKQADMIIAVTFADEVNMMACQVAHSLFEVPTKIARVRSQEYLRPEWKGLFAREHLPIDVVISPEVEIAQAVTRRLITPGAIDMIPFADDKVRVVGIYIDEGCPIVDTPLRQLTELFPDLHIRIMGIFRSGVVRVPHGNEEVHIGDEVYFAVETPHMERAMRAFGHDELAARRVVIIGGGNVGLFLARQIEDEHRNVSIKLIEAQADRATFIAGEVKRTIVIHGNALEREILDEANVGTAETVVAVTDNDEVNVLASLLAKHAGCRRAITLVNNAAYPPLTSSLGIDVAVNPRAVTVSRVLHYVRRGRIRSVYSIRDGLAEVIEGEAVETSPMAGSALRDVKLPEGIVIGALVRDDQVLIPRGSTVIEAKDRVILLTPANTVRNAEKLFSVRLEFF